MGTAAARICCQSTPQPICAFFSQLTFFTLFLFRFLHCFRSLSLQSSAFSFTDLCALSTPAHLLQEGLPSTLKQGGGKGKIKHIFQ